MLDQATFTSEKQSQYDPLSIEEMQDFLVVWLDYYIHSSNQDYQDAITQLQHIVTDIPIFTDNDQCIDFILNNIHSKVCLITSGSIGQLILPCIHDIPNIDSIFIFCDNQNRHEQLTKKWLKVKCVSIDIMTICEQLKQIIRRHELNDIPMSFVQSGKRPDQLDPSFMYTKIIKEILLTIRFEHKHIREYVDFYCDKFVDNDVDRKKVKQLEDEYDKRTPIWWYTTERFLYGMLNRALRVMDGKVMTLMGFFISDLHRHIEELYKQQFKDKASVETFTVYRGQGLSKKAFDELVASKGGLMSFNNFLSTSRNRNVSLIFTLGSEKSRDVVSVLFVMTIDPKQSTTVLASVRGISQSAEEEEVLFSMHSIFHINDVKPIQGNEEVYEVKLSLTSDNDEKLRVLTEQIRKESFPDGEGWKRLGLVFSNIGQLDIAEQIYRVTVHEKFAGCLQADTYNQLGTIKHQQGQYEEAIILYHKSLEIQQQSLPSNHSDVAKSYNNIGNVYSDMGDYSRALSSYEQALEIQQQSLPSNHPDVASSYSNIGNVYSNMGDYSTALSSFEQALNIRQQSLPSNHPDVASSYNNIGIMYRNMGDYSRALSSYEQALEIQQQSLPSNHPDVAASYNNIGAVYRNMGDYSRALSSYEQALKIQQQSLPSNHPDVASSYNNIGNVYAYMGDYSRALSSYERALSIRQQSLPSNHPDVAKSYNNIGAVYAYMGDYSRALSSFEQALSIRQQSLPSNHPDVAKSYNNIGNVYTNMGDYSRALSSYERALSIRQQSLPSNHPDVAKSYNNIGNVYSYMGDYPNACLFYEYALEIGQQVLPSTHSHLQLYKRNAEEMQHILGVLDLLK
ncbi:unnamed protein product [Adineta ricciae]|uniref:ADP ribosyltransferase domain-containing protein n=1 Tax=Adineta ricciae TaxID=249248 RepID=A0A815DTS9_ADIRI|nr:unnamed protein product [Adineta ricciae]CAF1305708.1 unnamed protein product [Adineta ricciae]